jgi:hypothetical protein
MKTLFAAAVALAAWSGAAAAQDGRSMDGALSMLESSVARHFAQLGITDVDPMALTLNQLARINSALAGSAGNSVRTRIRVMTIVDDE